VETIAPSVPYPSPVNIILLPATYQYVTIFMSILVTAALALLALVCTRRLRMVPGRAQALMELIVTAFRDLVYSTMGPKDGRRFLPLIGTIFLFVWTSNMIGLIPMADILVGLTGEPDLRIPVGDHTLVIPGFQEPTRNVNTPWALGIMVFFIMHIAAVVRKGPAKYFDEYFTPHLGEFTWPLQKPLMRALGAMVLAGIWAAVTALAALAAGAAGRGLWMPVATVGAVSLAWCLVRLPHWPRRVGVPNLLIFPLNVIGKFAEILSMSFRLFGNIFGGAVIVALLGGMTYQIALPIVLQMFMGVFVGTVQAFVFSMLSLVYITVEISRDEGSETAEEDEVAATAAET
jgi:F0F1-type ATP synthase membrane subunit a